MSKIFTLVNNETFKKYAFISIAVVLIAIFCFSITPVSFQNDVFYNIKVGEIISKNGIDNQDHFSWNVGLSYTYPHWLYDLIVYFIYSISNFDGLYVVTCILSCFLGITLYAVSSKLSKNYIVSFITTIGALYLMRAYITARAQLVTFILFILAIYCIEEFLKNRTLRHAAGLILISLLIANLHCAVWLFLFVLFLPYIAEYFVAIIADILIYKKTSILFLKLKIKKLDKKSKNNKKIQEKIEALKNKVNDIENANIKIKIRRDKDLDSPYKIRITRNKNTKWLIVVLIICILMGFVTPLGTTPFTYLAKTLQGNTTKNINEHLPLTLYQNRDILIAIAIFLSLLIFTKVKIKLSDLAMLTGLTFLMLASARQCSMFALICSIILAKLLVEIINTNFKGNINGFNNFFTDAKTIFLITILSLLLSYYQYDGKKDDAFVTESEYPIQACDYILNNIDLTKAKIFNEYNYGSYMLFRGIPVFIDSRADLYSPEFNNLNNNIVGIDKDVLSTFNLDSDIFMDFIKTQNIDVYYGEIFEKYNATHVILYNNSKVKLLIDNADNDKYKMIYSDDYFSIYEIINSTVEQEVN